VINTINHKTLRLVKFSGCSLTFTEGISRPPVAAGEKCFQPPIVGTFVRLRSAAKCVRLESSQCLLQKNAGMTCS
jgi:hypothetical protein